VSGVGVLPLPAWLSGSGGPWRPVVVWSAVGVGFAAALAGVVGLALYLAPEPGTTRFVARPAASSAACPLTPSGTARCVTTAECFDQVTVNGGVARAPKVACAGPHLWEAFALASLPRGLDNANHTTIKRNPEVLQVCSAANARRLNAESPWQIEVLPPSREQVRAGDRTYRCLAGRPPAKLTTSRFAR
jgi:hypothetical protein